MVEYIDRQAAINSIRGMEDVYVNNLPPMICKEEARMELVKLPPSDVVEVVRCKDCKYQDKGQNEVESWNVCNYRPWLYVNTYDDHFCSYGERKE